MSLRVTVAGAGVFGLACAVRLAGVGADVLILDPAPEDASASSVAAGMLAPVGERLFDPIAAPHHELMTHALDLWQSFAGEAGIVLAGGGVVVPHAMGPSLAVLGLGADPHPLGLLVDVDPRVDDPAAALGALRAQALALGVRFESRVYAPGVDDRGDVVVLATGPGALSADGPPERIHLSPVKGQIAILPHGPAAGPVVRWAGGYLAPRPGGARVGATMEPGRDDAVVEPEAIARLVEAARLRIPSLDVSGAWGQAGVRVQAPDGLPLVGPSRTPGVLLAIGARRNGWLLAPLVASAIAAYCKGEDSGPFAAIMRADRFDG